MIDEKKLKQYQWQKWIERDWQAFIISLFAGCETEESFYKIGAKGVVFEAWFFQHGYWYKSQEVWDKMSISLLKWLKKDSIFALSTRLKKFHQDNLKIIEQINNNKKGDIGGQLEELRKILSLNTTYIWMAHGLEIVYKQKLDQAIKKHQIKDAEKFIGDISFPVKKNLSAMMSEAILRGDKVEDIWENFSWIRVRNGFDRPYTIKEIEVQIKDINRPSQHRRPTVPKDMKKLVAEMQELVFFRTERTDVFYHLLFTARPLLKRVAKYYNIKFEDLKYYSIQSLTSGRPKKYGKYFSALGYGANLYYGNKKIIKDEIIKDKEIKGTIAYKGLVSGIVKIVTVSGDLSKVKQGDILVTQMTFPAFMIAMNKASAFVTDEGGITCHAAIVAREMKKPCIIGTRIATKVLKDGDLVEVDANQGLVKIIK